MNVSTAVKAIKVLRVADVPLLLHGPPGAGKTSAFKQAAYEIHQEDFGGSCDSIEDYYVMNRERLINDDIRDDEFLCFILEVPNMDPTDSMGVPNPIQTERGFVTKWARPDFIFDRGNGLLVFDEMTNGDSLTTQALRNIMLERRVKTHFLSPNWYPCGAGNRAEDKSFSRALPSPLITRLCHLGVGCDAPNFTEETVDKADVDAKEWLLWAMSKNVRSEIVGFIKDRPSTLYCNQAVPRTWHFTSKILDGVCKVIGEASLYDSKGPDNALVQTLVSGTIGAKMGHDLQAHIRLKSKIPNIDDILKKPKETKVPKETSIQHILCVELIYRATLKTADSIMTYATKKDSFGPETQSFLVHGILHKDSSLMNSKLVCKWCDDHVGLIS